MKTALLSVSDKSGLVPFARGLAEAGIHLLSTGGTAKTLREAGLDVQDVADYTGDPEIFEGRVKTLNPKIHGAILWDRSKADHKATAVAEGIGEIDLVVVNLYPFTQTVASGADFQTCIENIDIGGPAMVRASAKNHASVGIVVDPSDYEAVLVEIKADGALSNTKRKQLAAKAYAHTAAYDSAISGWFAAEVEEQFPEQLSFTGNVDEVLRYGENPHQFAAFYKDGSNRAGVATAEQLQGKSLSYNNLNDTDAAFEAVCEFEDPAVVIVKHANPCGVATAPSGDLFQAYDKAHACDTVSAFGGIVALNRPLDGPTAERISQIFTEVIIAPSVD
ncbi:MAG: bifunctional phosphoribosylaminoimidazolecarboxamide formyltransferase/IMP cyclohydrolase, partial [Alphaproteobacteria bacterium]